MPSAQSCGAPIRLQRYARTQGRRSRASTCVRSGTQHSPRYKLYVLVGAGRGYRGNRKQTEDRWNRLRKRRRETLRELKNICIRVVQRNWSDTKNIRLAPISNHSYGRKPVADFTAATRESNG